MVELDVDASRDGVSDDQGRYAVPDLAIGAYEIQVTKPGFQTSVRSGLTLNVGSAAVLDFQMMVGQATETVSVSAEAAQVETTSAAVSSPSAIFWVAPNRGGVSAATRRRPLSIQQWIRSKRSRLAGRASLNLKCAR